MEAAVGILQSASQCLISEKFRDITEDFDGKLSEMKKESKSRSRCKTSKVFFRCIFYFHFSPNECPVFMSFWLLKLVISATSKLIVGTLAQQCTPFMKIYRHPSLR